METIAFCEIEDYSCKVLRKHWPHVPIHRDIKELNGRRYRGTVDLVCGGFPCQPFSVAGKQRGAEDDRALWPEMLRVIREVAPRYVIAENVTGIIRMELDSVLSDLEDSGYACQTFVIPACGVDAPHRRDRVWIIASHTNGPALQPMANTHPERQLQSQGVEQEQRGWAGNSSEDVAHAKRKTEGRWRIQRPSKNSGEDEEGPPKEFGRYGEAVADTDSNDGRGRSGSQPRGRHSRVEHSGSSPRQHKQGSNEDVVHGYQRSNVRGIAIWEPEPSVGRVANGIPRRVDRLKGLGNAVVPQIVEEIGRIIMVSELGIKNNKTSPPKCPAEKIGDEVTPKAKGRVNYT